MRRTSALPEGHDRRLTNPSAPDLFARLRCVPLFHSLEDAVLRRMQESFSLMSLPKEGVLLSNGQINEHMYVLLSGSLRVHLGSPQSEAIARVGPGESVGELSVIDQRPTSAHVIADCDCELVRIGERGFWELVAASHEFAVHLMHKLAERLRANNTAVLETTLLRDEFKRAALFDALTGVHNRRWLDDTLPQLVERHLRVAHPMSAAMIDVDHFKRFNDTHGHDAGDSVLKAVAKTIHDQLRPSDVVARFGGEEFVVLFPDTDLTGAYRAAQRLLRSVATCHIDAPSGATLPTVTISLGLARLDVAEPKALLKRCDEALYLAKAGGRNRIECATARADAVLDPPGQLKLDNTD